MIYKINEYVYLVKDKYTFKKQMFLDNKRLVYCLVAIKGNVIHGLLQSFFKFSKDEADEAINEYLKNKRRLISFGYKNAKEIIKITKYNIGNK